jgi:hypothetical protein
MARPRLGEGASERLQMLFPAEEIEAIDAWRYDNRVPSRSEAIRRLVTIGLTSKDVSGSRAMKEAADEEG